MNRACSIVLTTFVACGGATREHVDIAPVVASPQPETHGALAPPAQPLVGTYKLDAAALRASEEARMASLSGEDLEAAKLGLSTLESMDVTLVLEAGGVVTVTMSMKSDPPAKPQPGTWRRDGDDVILERDGKDIRCKVAANELACVQKKNQTFVFKRATP